jgi:hypothetical protein
MIVVCAGCALLYSDHPEKYRRTTTDHEVIGGFEIHIRLPGFEPGSRPWEGRIIPLDHSRVRSGRSRCTHKRCSGFDQDQMRIPSESI